MQVIDLPLDTNSSNLAKITLDGRYPEQGYAANALSEMTIYVLEGAVVLKRENSEEMYVAESAVVVSKGQRYCWLPDRSVTLLIFSTPPWTVEQQIIS